MVTGYSDSNSIITASRAREAHNKIVGARGEVVVNTIADRSGLITFSLLQTSDWNSTLRSRLELNQNTGLSGNAGTFLPMQILLSDKMGNDLVTGINGWISLHPTFTRGTGVNTVNWIIEVERINFAEGKTSEVGV